MKKAKHILLIAAFSAYAVLMLWLLFGQRMDRLFFSPDGYITAISEKVNLIPFRTIAEFVKGLSDTGRNGAAVINLYGNVIMFVPLGFFIPAVFPKARSLRRCMLVSLAVLVCVEVIQFVTLLGSLDIDDIILNLAGVLVGYGFFKILNRIKR